MPEDPEQPEDKDFMVPEEWEARGSGAGPEGAAGGCVAAAVHRAAAMRSCVTVACSPAAAPGGPR